MTTQEENLRNSFNEFWSDFFKTPKDYYAEVSTTKLLKLKSILSNINGIITNKATIVLAHRLARLFRFSPQEEEKLFLDAKNADPNANGYDLQYDGSVKFIAEIKCNWQVKEKKFAENQIKGLKKDVDSLLHGKKKSKIRVDAISTYYKFLGLYRFDDNTEEALNAFVDGLPSELSDRLEIFCDDTKLMLEKIYVIWIQF